MSVKEFIAKYTPYANQVAIKYGVPSLVTLSQAAWESGWGKHAPKYNFFGMTAGSNYTGKKQLLWTSEYKNGIKVRVQRYFRAYDNPIQAFADYAYNLQTQGSYDKAFAYKRDPIKFFDEVYKGGYATDPNYYTSVLKSMNMIKKYVV